MLSFPNRPFVFVVCLFFLAFYVRGFLYYKKRLCSNPRLVGVQVKYGITYWTFFCTLSWQDADIIGFWQSAIMRARVHFLQVIKVEIIKAVSEQIQYIILTNLHSA